MAITFGSTPITAIYQGSTLIAALRSVATEIPIGLPQSDPYDEYYDDVALLLQDSLTDESPQGQTVVANGTAAISTTQVKVGTHSLALAGSGNYLQIPSQSVAFGAGDFTLEGWIRPDSIGGGLQMIWDARTAGQNPAGQPVVSIDASGYIRLDAASANLLISTTPLQAATWTHFAITRFGTDLTVYLNGVASGTSTNSTAFGVTAAGVRVNGSNSGFNWFSGYLDAVRLTVGTARYTTNFTPPTAAFPATNGDPQFGSVSLLLQDSLADESLQGQTLVINGNTALDATDPKYGSHAISMAAVGDYISMTIDSSLDFSGEFTAECWIKTTSGSNSGAIFNHRRYSYNATDLFLLGFTGTDKIFTRIGGKVTSKVSAASVLDGDWHHVASCRDSTHLRLYVDGVEVTNVEVPSSFTINPIGLEFRIGSMKFYGSRQFIGEMDDIRITNGFARYPGGTTFTPPTAAFPAAGPVDESFSSVALLLQDSLTDESLQGQTITATGTASTSTTQSKFGGTSFLTNGTSNLVTAANDPAFAMPGDFTLESWIYFDSYAANEQYRIWRPVNHSSGGFNSNRLQFLVFNDKLYTDVYGAVLVQSGALGLSAGQWYHVAASRQGSTLRLFLDGVEVASGTTTRSFVADEYQLPYSFTTARQMYFDDFRYTQGAARYTAAFTPPTAPHPDTNGDYQFGNVSLLLQDSLADESLQGQTVIANGSAAASTSQVKIGTHSIGLAGANNYLQIPSQSVAFGSGDFTLETWVRPDSIAALQMLWDARTAGSNPAGQPVISINASGYIQVDAASTNLLASSTAIAAGVWSHIALVRYGTTLAIYINGVAAGTASNSTAFGVTAAGVRINGSNSGYNWFSGYIDGLRLTVGKARYTSDFTPPTAAFPN